MNYKYPPVYKYALFLLLTYAFLRHQHIMPLDKILFNSIAITFMIIALDYLIIRDHVTLLDNTKTEQFTKNNDLVVDTTIIDDDEIDDIIDACDSNDDDFDDPDYQPEPRQSRFTYARKQYGAY
jgi:hypothetical protein